MEFVTALASLQTVIGLAQVAIKSHDDIKLQEAMNTMSERLSGALALAIDFQSRCLELERANEQLSKKVADEADYVLSELVAGVFALAYKREEGDPVPFHYVCQPCMADSRKIVLQRSTNGTQLLCKHSGTHTIRIKDAPPLDPIPYTNHWNY